MNKKAAINKDIARIARHLVRLSGKPFLKGIGLHAQAASKAMEVVGVKTYSGSARLFLRDHFEKLDEYVRKNAKLSAQIRKDKVASRKKAPWLVVPDTPHNQYVKSDEFLRSFEWRKVRMQALKKYGPKCMCCGATPATGAVMNVDHIKPRKLFPSLALDVSNLQILCHDCNHGKGNWDTTDWRPE